MYSIIPHLVITLVAAQPESRKTSWTQRLPKGGTYPGLESFLPLMRVDIPQLCPLSYAQEVSWSIVISCSSKGMLHSSFSDLWLARYQVHKQHCPWKRGGLMRVKFDAASIKAEDGKRIYAGYIAQCVMQSDMVALWKTLWVRP